MTKEATTAEILEGADAAIEQALTPTPPATPASEPSAGKPTYNLATQETARLLISRQEELSRLIAEDDREIEEVTARRADRFKAFDVLSETLERLR